MKQSLGIRNRILLAALAPATLVAFLVTGMLVAEQMKQAQISQHRRLEAVARQLAVAAEYNLFVGNTDALQRLIDSALAEPDVVAAAILDRRDKVLASSLTTDELPAPAQVEVEFQPPAVSEGMHHWHSLPILASHYNERDLFSAPPPAGESPPLGHLLLKISNQSLYDEIRHYALTAALISVSMLVFGVLLALGLSRGLIRMLSQIGRVVESIGQGRHDQRIEKPGDDELGHLAHGINAMADAVGETQEMLSARIAHATAILRHERDEAALAAQARGRFFAAASHDLRQPVQALGLFIAKLEHDAGRSKLRPQVEQVARSVHNLQELLDTLLDYSRLDGQVYRLDERPVRAHDIITPILAEFSATAAARGLTLRERVADCWLLTDPSLLRRTLINLVSNAIRYTRHGTVLLACRRGATHARIEVWDTGPGIPAEKQSAIFEELVQLENPERDASKGLGLGLAIVRRTLNLLRHPLQLHSRVGKGSCFSIMIPITAPPLENAGSQELAADTATHILVIGAQTAERGSLAGQIDGWGYAPAEVSDEAAAADWIGRHGAPALLLLETEGKLQQTHDMLDRLDARAGTALPALLIHPGPLPSDQSSRARRLTLSRPFRPARLRALIDHQLAEVEGFD